MPYKPRGSGYTWVAPTLNEKGRESLLKRYVKYMKRETSETSQYPGPTRASMARMTAEAWSNYYD